MRALGELARVELVLIIGLLLVAVFFQVLTGRIQIAGILQNKTTGGFDPARLQLLVLSVLVGGLMLTRLDEMRVAHALSLPTNIVYAAGGSQLLYLIRKVFQIRSGP